MFNTPENREIVIMGTTISIEIDDDRCVEEGADGLYILETIYLKSSYDTRDQYRITYLHECFHALCDVLGVQLDHNLEEILAHRVSTMVVSEI